MADKWGAIIENDKSGQSATIDVNAWLGKATLDACVLVSVFGVHGLRANRELISQRIGAGGFDYDFGALDDADNSFTKSYTDLMYDNLSPSSVVQGSRRANCQPYTLASPLSGTPLGYFFSS